MDLKSGAAFWSVKNGLIRNHPALTADHATDVLIIGAGISGALVAHELSRNGHRVTVVDRRPVAYGSTSGSTALLQYEIDTHLVDLAKQFGEERAALAYRSCVRAIDRLSDITDGFDDVEFCPQKSLYLTPLRRETDTLRAEYELRRKHGLPVHWLDRAALINEFGCEHGYAGILSEVAGIVDPYRLAHRLLKGVEVFADTHVTHIDRHTHGITAQTSRGHSITAKHVVIACGYESQNHLPQRYARNRSTYALISEPMLPPIEGDTLDTPSHATQEHFLQTTLYWETSRPYPYIRRTFDGRIMIGGEDDSVDIAIKRDALLARKSRKLLKTFRDRFPSLDFRPAFAWAGTFAETEDGLPYIGTHNDTGERVHFVMAYGGNGIVYSVLAAEIIRATIEGDRHELQHLFGFTR